MRCSKLYVVCCRPKHSRKVVVRNSVHKIADFKVVKSGASSDPRFCNCQSSPSKDIPVFFQNCFEEFNQGASYFKVFKKTIYSILVLFEMKFSLCRIFAKN